VHQDAPLDRSDAVDAADRLAERNVDEDRLDRLYSHDVASMALPPARVKRTLLAVAAERERLFTSPAD
jgi:hypothetical protein